MALPQVVVGFSCAREKGRGDRYAFHMIIAIRLQAPAERHSGAVKQGHGSIKIFNDNMLAEDRLRAFAQTFWSAAREPAPCRGPCRDHGSSHDW